MTRLQKLLEDFLFVHRCWEDSEMAKRERMTVERAIALLRNILREAQMYPGGLRLTYRATRLLRHIVMYSVPPYEPPTEAEEIELLRR